MTVDSNPTEMLEAKESHGFLAHIFLTVIFLLPLH